MFDLQSHVKVETHTLTAVPQLGYKPGLLCCVCSEITQGIGK